LIVKVIDAGGFGEVFQLSGWEIGRKILFPAGGLQHGADMFQPPGLQYLFKKEDSGVCIPPGPVTVRGGDAQVAADVAQAVAGGAGKGLAAETHRAELLTIQVQVTGFQLVFDEGIVEVYVVGHEDGAGKPFMDNVSYLIEIRGVGHHFVIDAGEGLYIAGDEHAGIDQGLIALKLPVSIV